MPRGPEAANALCCADSLDREVTNVATTQFGGQTQELAGKVALVTGGARNIGAATSLALAAAGAAVAVNTRKSREDADAIVGEIRSGGGQAEVYMADIADAAAAKRMVAGVVERFGKVDILVLNASVRKETPFLEISADEWRGIMGISVDGSFHLCQACIPSMLTAGGGSIVMLGGTQALSGASRRVHGSVAKHGMVGMTRALAREFAERNIRVNCVAPGRMDTLRAAGRTVRGDPKGIPLGRLGEPREIADTVRFLCGPGASYITGQLIYVNGGLVMY
jgi:3-oxoacyl-[acyl-carrier protein] reductase